MTDIELKTALKELIVETLHLDDVKPGGITDEEPLFSPTEGLGLDSLSALEMLSAIEFKFKVSFDSDGTAKQHFKSVSTLAAFLLPRL